MESGWSLGPRLPTPRGGSTSKQRRGGPGSGRWERTRWVLECPCPGGGEAGGRGRGPPRDHGTAPEAGLGQARGGEPAAPPAVDLVSVPLGLQEGERV